MVYVAGNPHFECVVADEDTRQRLIEKNRPEAQDLRTCAEAEAKLAQLYTHYVREMHPG